MSQTPGPTPDQLRDKNRRELKTLQDQVGRLLGRLSFADALQDLAQARGALPGLGEGVASLRARGYRFRVELEGVLAEAEARADALVEDARQETARSGRDLRAQVERLQADVRALERHDLIAIAPLLDQQEAAARRVEQALGEVERRVQAIGEPLTSRVRLLQSAVKDLSWTLDCFAQGSFSLLPEENPVAAAKASWKDAPGGERPGLLLFTDHRLRFEHVEEKVTKRKLLFFAAETEQIKQTVVDEPIGHLLGSVDQESGLIVKDQLLVLTWDRKARCPERTTFELDGGKAADWDGVVERLMKGDLERDMVAQAPRPDVHGVPVQWPEKCGQCGANLDAPVKGQTTIVCGYCTAEHDVVMGQG